MNVKLFFPLAILAITLLGCEGASKQIGPDETSRRVEELLKTMTLEEKIGQLVQKNGSFEQLEEYLRGGRIGSVLNEPNPQRIYELQRIAVEESRLGIPLIIARDVIHGFKTIMPIPLGLAATWNPELVEMGARVAAIEAASQGIRWTFAPMIDVTRDPRWGRIAESFGEDHFMTGVMGAASVRGFQGDSLNSPYSLAACAKHFAAYGFVEGGRDYNTVSIPYNKLHDVVLPPFRASIDAGVATIMTAFNDINGVPATGNRHLLREVLRDQWGYQGVVVSDWMSVTQLVVHGYSPNDKEAAFESFTATTDMEMASTSYETYLMELVNEKRVKVSQIDEAVRRILTLKFRLGLFDAPYAHMENEFPELVNDQHREIAKQAAKESVVLLKNERNTLPVSMKGKRVAVIGPLADAPHDQMGTWVFDGEKRHSVTPLTSISELANREGFTVYYHRALEISRSKTISNASAMMRDVTNSDVVLLFLGEESILSGESHCLADIGLPGAQEELIRMVAGAGKPVVGIIMAGRPTTFEEVLPYMDAVMYAWHPGTMAGPALSDLIFGFDSPSGKLPVTFPRHVGTIPIYYNHLNTGKPASDQTWVRYDDIPVEAFQLSIGNTNHYLDYGFEPMFHFGFGLSYSQFELSNLMVMQSKLSDGQDLQVSIKIKNSGSMEASEVVQLYVRDEFASRARPVKELKAFEKVRLKPGEEREVQLKVRFVDLGFHNQQMKHVVEPGTFKLWVGTCSRSGIEGAFEVVAI